VSKGLPSQAKQKPFWNQLGELILFEVLCCKMSWPTIAQYAAVSISVHISHHHVVKAIRSLLLRLMKGVAA